ncbi:MAG: hypothetical protein ACPGD8_00905 [Flavobacteriales bacterium]
MGCSNAITVLDPSCEALKKVGGFDKTFYVGNVADLVSVTIPSATVLELTAFTFDSGKGFKKITGKRLKHGANATLEVGDTVNSRIQNFNSVLYAKSGAERHALEELADAEDIFIVAESNSGTLEVFGIGKDPLKFDNYGLKASAAEWKHGVLLNDDTSVTMTFTGSLPNAAMIYDEAETLATNITALDAQVV